MWYLNTGSLYCTTCTLVLWYLNTRGNDGSRQLRLGDFKLEGDEQGEYVRPRCGTSFQPKHVMCSGLPVISEPPVQSQDVGYSTPENPE